MINFIDGKINISTRDIRVDSDHDELNVLAEEGFIEKRVDAKGKTSYYTESMSDGMRFGISITVREERINWLLLRWLDGPCTSKGWDNVSEKSLTDEYRLLSNFVKQKIGVSPSNKINGTRTWLVKWGRIEVSHNARDFDVAIFMEPK